MKKRLLASLLLSAIVLSLFCACGTIDSHSLNVLFLNSGKSDCILIRTKSTTILVDTGYSQSADAIVGTLEEEGVKQIDYMILTHYDKDHIGSAATLLRTFPVGQVYLPDYDTDTKDYRRLVLALDETETPVVTVRETIALKLKEGATVRICPTQLTDVEDENNYSLITSVRWGDFGLLLLGDALKDRITEYMAQDTDVYQVVKLPHHGDYFKKLEEYMSVMKPAYGVLCCGEEREVEEELLDMCGALSIQVRRTDEGAIRLSYDAKTGTYAVEQA